jgi:hypothetical protein
MCSTDENGLSLLQKIQRNGGRINYFCLLLNAPFSVILIPAVINYSYSLFRCNKNRPHQESGLPTSSSTLFHHRLELIPIDQPASFVAIFLDAAGDHFNPYAD